MSGTANLPIGSPHILQHSLGVDEYGRGEQYRNHFVTGEGSDDHPTCNALVEAGLMGVRRAMAISGGMDGFWVTPAGKAYVAEHSPPAPKVSAGRQRYLDWLSMSDVTGERFIDFLRRCAREQAVVS